MVSLLNSWWPCSVVFLYLRKYRQIFSDTCRSSCYPPKFYDAIGNKDRIGRKHVGVLQPLGDCLKNGQLVVGLVLVSLRPRVQVLTTRPPSPFIQYCWAVLQILIIAYMTLLAVILLASPLLGDLGENVHTNKHDMFVKNRRGQRGYFLHSSIVL